MLQQAIIFLFANPFLFLSLIFGFITLLLNKNLTKKKISVLFFIAFALFVIYSGFLAFSQYQIWQKSPLMKYTLPPHNSINYFLLYSYHLFFKRVLWRLADAVLIFILLIGLDRLLKKSLFYLEEFYLIPFLTFLIDFPLGFLLLPAGLLILMCNHFFKADKMLIQKYTLKSYWSYLAILLIIINIILANYYSSFYKIQP